jgi:hypothetical protein
VSSISLNASGRILLRAAPGHGSVLIPIIYKSVALTAINDDYRTSCCVGGLDNLIDDFGLEGSVVLWESGNQGRVQVGRRDPFQGNVGGQANVADLVSLARYLR